MIKIDNEYNITMTRGDTFAKTLTLTKGGKPYTPASGDVIKFTMSRTYKGKMGYRPLLEKVIDHETMLWIIDASDTESMEYGKYVYDLEITYGDTGYVETFADRKTLMLTEEVG